MSCLDIILGIGATVMLIMVGWCIWDSYHDNDDNLFY